MDIMVIMDIMDIITHTPGGSPYSPSAVGMTVVRRRSSDVASCGANLSLAARATNLLN
jgi:hypothetical protein